MFTFEINKLFPHVFVLIFIGYDIRRNPKSKSRRAVFSTSDRLKVGSMGMKTPSPGPAYYPQSSLTHRQASGTVFCSSGRQKSFEILPGIDSPGPAYLPSTSMLSRFASTSSGPSFDGRHHGIRQQSRLKRINTAPSTIKQKGQSKNQLMSGPSEFSEFSDQVHQMRANIWRHLRTMPKE